MAALAAAVAAGVLLWWRQWNQGLALTGMSRDVAWGLYIGQFTFFVGVAASAVTVVLPYYLHAWKAFGRVVIPGELLTIASVVVALLFVFVDLGRPDRLPNVVLIPAGFIPSPEGAVTPYIPTAVELGIVLAIWCAGALLVTVLFRIAEGYNRRSCAAHPSWFPDLVA